MGQRYRGRLGSVLGLGQRRNQSRITMSTQRATMITWRLDPSTGEVFDHELFNAAIPIQFLAVERICGAEFMVIFAVLLIC